MGVRWVKSVEQGVTTFRLVNPNPVPVTPALLAEMREWYRREMAAYRGRGFCAGAHVREVRVVE